MGLTPITNETFTGEIFITSQNGCSQQDSAMANKIAWIGKKLFCFRNISVVIRPQEGGGCSFFEKNTNAKNAGAKGVMISDYDYEYLELRNTTGLCR